MMLLPAATLHGLQASGSFTPPLPTHPLSLVSEEDFQGQAWESKGRVNIPETLLLCWIQQAPPEISPCPSFSLPYACPSAVPGVSRCPQGRTSLTCWYIPHQHHFLRFLKQGKSCGFERERHYSLVTAEQVFLLKPGVCCCFPGWKLPLHGAGADMAVASTGEAPPSRQGASQPN